MAINRTHPWQTLTTEWLVSSTSSTGGMHNQHHIWVSWTQCTCQMHSTCLQGCVNFKQCGSRGQSRWHCLAEWLPRSPFSRSLSLEILHTVIVQSMHCVFYTDEKQSWVFQRCTEVMEGEVQLNGQWKGTMCIARAYNTQTVHGHQVPMVPSSSKAVGTKDKLQLTVIEN